MSWEEVIKRTKESVPHEFLEEEQQDILKHLGQIDESLMYLLKKEKIGSARYNLLKEAFEKLEKAYESLYGDTLEDVRGE